jgi:hypothetical protein
MAINKRRSDRLMLTVPLTVQGTDERGFQYQDPARTSVLNRHGARIQIERRLRSGEKVRLVNMLNLQTADFRIVGPVAPFSGSGGEFGVECVDRNANIWGIQFPPLREGESAESKALLECHKCHTVMLVPLSLVEVEVLETSGILTNHCERCNTPSPFGYAEKQIGMGRPADAEVVAAVQAEVDAIVANERRRHRRIALQLPVRVRDYQGGIEISKSENISKGGFCFSSEKDYQVGEGLLVVCPYNEAGQSIEVRARVVRRREIAGSSRKVFGISYDTLTR